jgi:hypothetical protein
MSSRKTGTAQANSLLHDDADDLKVSADEVMHSGIPMYYRPTLRVLKICNRLCSILIKKVNPVPCRGGLYGCVM